MFGSDSTRRGRTGVAMLVAGALVAAALSACTPAKTTTSTRGSTTLTIGQNSPPTSLDPAQDTAGLNTWYHDLAYDPLVYSDPDGVLRPRLATSWHYVGTGNRVFELTLRPGVRFSDGSPLTAAVVKANIAYFAKAKGAYAAYAGAISSVETRGPRTVRLHFSKPNPHAARILSQDFLLGDMISGPALEKPGTLANRTAGAGPYAIDPAHTVANSQYTFVPNPHYWNHADVHYKKVVVRVLPKAGTALAALKSGQADVIHGDFSTAGAARSAGMNIVGTPSNMTGLVLADQSGERAKALGDRRVRQALNYAVDRRAITKALSGTYGVPTDQIAPSGEDGHNDADLYGYDPGKARSLLVAAGYAKGFTLPVVTTSYASIDVTTQAVADYLRKVGVQLKITDVDVPQYFSDIDSGKFAAFGVGYGVNPVFVMGPSLFQPTAAFNPFRTKDADLDDLYQRAAAAAPARAAELDRQIVARLRDRAWFLPVSFVPVFFFAGPGVAGVRTSAAEHLADPVAWRPAG